MLNPSSGENARALELQERNLEIFQVSDLSVRSAGQWGRGSGGSGSVWFLHMLQSEMPCFNLVYVCFGLLKSLQTPPQDQHSHFIIEETEAQVPNLVFL